GGAIWSMHFIGMNAADMGVPVAYDPLLTFVSLILAVVAPAIGLFIVGRSDGGPWNLPLGGVLTGLGVALMHYTGMAAMIMPAKITYDTTLFAASIEQGGVIGDRKSTRLNSSHVAISYAVFCLKKKKKK